MPPKTPVYEYHWTQLGWIEKTLPNVNQGQFKSQLKCKISKPIQREERKNKPEMVLNFVFKIWKKVKTRVMKKALQSTAKSPSPKAGDAFSIQKVVEKLKIKKDI